MEIQKIIKELRGERDRIDTLILALEHLNSGPRSGRPPKALQELRAKIEAARQGRNPSKRRT